MKTLFEYILEQKLIVEDDDLGLDDLDSSSGDDDDSGDDSGDDSDDDSKDAKPVEQPNKKEKETERGKIKFTIWETPDKKIPWLDDNEAYQKIEYKFEDKQEGIEIDFLLGYQEDSWKLWIGKIGACSYDDDPYCSFNTEKFSKAVVAALDKVEEFLEEVRKEPDNYIQFYINR